MTEGIELRLWRTATTAAWRVIGSLDVVGVHNIPRDGGFLLLSNHQSVLDPFFIQGACPRALHPMTKSTQFAGRLFRVIMPHFNAFPVRRYQPDPQAVRIALRRLAAGCAVHIYIEGERTWDGRFQEPRRGTVRLALKAGVPVVPCTIAGSYHVWPRWGRGIRRARVSVTFGEPIFFPACGRRIEREPHVEKAAHRISSAIAKPLESTSTDHL